MNRETYNGEAKASLRKFTGLIPRGLRHSVLGLSLLVAGAGALTARAAEIADIEEERVTECSAENTTPDAEKIFAAADQPASFPGGKAALMQWIGTNLRYPVSAQEKGVQGKVVVKFVIEKDGSITNPTVVRSVNQDLDKEAIRIVHMMPKWVPAKIDGNVVRSYCTLPIGFRLRGN